MNRSFTLEEKEELDKLAKEVLSDMKKGGE
jgi:hypothetical protein